MTDMISNRAPFVRGYVFASTYFRRRHGRDPADNGSSSHVRELRVEVGAMRAVGLLLPNPGWSRVAERLCDAC